MAKVNWTFTVSALDGSVRPTADPVDGEEVFAKFTEARSALAEWFWYVSTQYRWAALNARGLRRADVPAELFNLVHPGDV